LPYGAGVVSVLDWLPDDPALVPPEAGAGVVIVVVLGGVVTVLVGAVTVVAGVVTVGERFVVCPMLSDWLVTVDVCFELPLDTNRTITRTTAMTSTAPPAIARPLRLAPPPVGGVASLPGGCAPGPDADGGAPLDSSGPVGGGGLSDAVTAVPCLRWDKMAGRDGASVGMACSAN
jgi:hypothetical protein